MSRSGTCPPVPTSSLAYSSAVATAGVASSTFFTFFLRFTFLFLVPTAAAAVPLAAAISAALAASSVALAASLAAVSKASAVSSVLMDLRKLKASSSSL